MAGFPVLTDWPGLMGLPGLMERVAMTTRTFFRRAVFCPVRIKAADPGFCHET